MKKSTIILFVAIIAGIFALNSCKNDTPIDTNPTKTEYTEDGTKTTVTDHGEGTGTMTWTKDKTWILKGFVFVNSGQILTIEKGTVIKGKPGEGENASALIVARGGKIIAEGTASEPIIFTAEADDLNGSVARTDKGLWGGLVILGNAKINTIPNRLNIEGIPTTEKRGEYGGDDDNDNSGIFKYISIRHGGTNIGADNEINGLTLGGVGSGTTIDFIEVFANNDDGFEFFGGTVQAKHLISAYCKDDGFDYDQGFRGKGQYWLVYQGNTGDRCGEFDGADDPENGTPYAIPELYNLTFVGNNSKKIMTFRANAGGKVFNSIFVNQTKGVDIELKENLTTETSYKRLIEHQLKIENNIFYNVADNSSGNVIKLKIGETVSIENTETANNNLVNYVAGANNTFTADPQIITSESSFNPVPAGAVSDNLATYPTAFFDNVSYKGAFDPNSENWAKGWTLLFK